MCGGLVGDDVMNKMFNAFAFVTDQTLD